MPWRRGVSCPGCGVWTAWQRQQTLQVVGCVCRHLDAVPGTETYAPRLSPPRLLLPAAGVVVTAQGVWAPDDDWDNGQADAAGMQLLRRMGLRDEERAGADLGASGATGRGSNSVVLRGPLCAVQCRADCCVQRVG